MRILFTSPVLEHPAAGGPQLRIENSIKALSRVCELDIISGSVLTVGSSGKDAREFYKQYCEEFYNLPRLALHASGNRYLRKLKRILRSCFKTDLKSDVSFLLAHVEKRHIDAIWFGYGNISFPLIESIKKHKPELRVVCDTDSVWSRFLLREVPYASGRRKRQIEKAGREKEAEERAWVNLCEVTTAVSDIDADYYRQLTRDKSQIHIFSNVVDIETYIDVPPAAPGLRNPSIYLAGTFWPNSPMENAARWVINEVLPLVDQEIPNVQFIVVGKGSDRVLGDIDDPRVVITGKLPTVLTYLCHVDVALVPLKFESGTRFKIIEAGACKIPLVSTSLGAEGIPVTDGQHILIADDAENFARAIVKLLTNRELALRLAENCHELINRKYSIDYLAEEAKPILRYLENG